jgi:hypothetical protein
VHRYQVEAVAKVVGGLNYRYALNGDAEGPAALPVEAPSQRRAIEALIATLSPEALTLSQSLIAQIPPKAYGYSRNRESAPARTGAQFDPLTLAEAAAAHSLDALLHPERLARLAVHHAQDSDQVSPDALFRRLQEAILLPEYQGLAAGVDRRRSMLLLSHWRKLLASADTAPDVRAAAHMALERALRLLRSRDRGNPQYRNFYRHQAWLIEQAFAGRGEVPEISPAPVPPGSPIGAS